jgi:hypothetical protein
MSATIKECLQHAHNVRRLAREDAVRCRIEYDSELGESLAESAGADIGRPDIPGTLLEIARSPWGRARQSGSWFNCMRMWARKALDLSRQERRARLAVRGEQLEMLEVA